MEIEEESGVEAPPSCCVTVSYLAHAVVSEFDVSLMVQENVVQLQVAVDDALLMKEVQSNADFSCVKPEKRDYSVMYCPLQA